MSVDQTVSDRMRADWNERAREDAHYYVAFGRRDQDEEEFYATAAEVLAGIKWELRHLGPASNPRARRALEIGCGPGRLMKPLSQCFGEIHGVDVSDEMIRMARERLRGIPHAHVHATDGANLSQFADESFDLVYSYAVFQHIPSSDIVMQYCREAHRVMKSGALLRAQFNGLRRTCSLSDTWSGARISSEELVEFTRAHDFQVTALEGVDTQYMWSTWRKRDAGWRERARAEAVTARIRRVTNAQNSEPVAPASGRYASISAWVMDLPGEADLFDLELRVEGQPARLTYIGPPDSSGLQQVNAILPNISSTGLLAVELCWFGRSIAPPAFLRVVPAGPQVPRVISVSDGVNLLAGKRIETRTVKITLDEVEDPAGLKATIDGVPVTALEWFCVDPLPRGYEVNLKLPNDTGPGPHNLFITLGRRRFAPITIEVC